MNAKSILLNQDTHASIYQWRMHIADTIIFYSLPNSPSKPQGMKRKKHRTIPTLYDLPHRKVLLQSISKCFHLKKVSCIHELITKVPNGDGMFPSTKVKTSIEQSSKTGPAVILQSEISAVSFLSEMVKQNIASVSAASMPFGSINVQSQQEGSTFSEQKVISCAVSSLATTSLQTPFTSKEESSHAPDPDIPMSMSAFKTGMTYPNFGKNHNCLQQKSVYPQ